MRLTARLEVGCAAAAVIGAAVAAVPPPARAPPAAAFTGGFEATAADPGFDIELTSPFGCGCALACVAAGAVPFAPLVAPALAGAFVLTAAPGVVAVVVLAVALGVVAALDLAAAWLEPGVPELFEAGLGAPVRVGLVAAPGAIPRLACAGAAVAAACVAFTARLVRACFGETAVAEWTVPAAAALSDALDAVPAVPFAFVAAVSPGFVAPVFCVAGVVTAGAGAGAVCASASAGLTHPRASLSTTAAAPPITITAATMPITARGPWPRR